MMVLVISMGGLPFSGEKQKSGWGVVEGATGRRGGREIAIGM